MNAKGKKRKQNNLSLDSNCNKQFKPCNECDDDHLDNSSFQATPKLSELTGQVEEDSLSIYTCTGGQWIVSPDQQHGAADDIVTLRSQEDVVLRSTKNGRKRAVTLLAKADASLALGHVRVISEGVDGIKLVTGVQKCFGDQDCGIGSNNVFVTVLIEDKHSTRIIEVGEILGYAKLIDGPRSSIFNTFFTVSFKSGVAKLKLGAKGSLQLRQDETTFFNVSVESLPKNNRKNYPIRFESTNSYLSAIGDRYTIQKGNSIRIRIRNVSGRQIVLRNGDILGIARALNTEEYIEKIQDLNKDSQCSISSCHTLQSQNTEKFIEEIQVIKGVIKSQNAGDFVEEIKKVDNDSSFPTEPTRLAAFTPDLVYSIVFLEIETLRPSNRSTKQITQIGCCSFLSKERNFFQVIEPRDLNHYLSNYQIAGDLLQFLHLQKNDSGHFEFRKQFEIVEDGAEVPQCTSEREALRELALFLGSFSSDCILVSIRKETIQLLVERMEHHGIDYCFLKGFCTWGSYLGNTISSVGSSVEFDDWYSANVSDDAPGGLHSEAVASLHKEAINRISETYFSRSSSNECPSWTNVATAIIQQSSTPIEYLFTSQSETNKSMRDSESLPTIESIRDSERESVPRFLELHNSFRPNFPATITITKLETLEISSDEDEAISPLQNDVSTTMEATPEMTNNGEIYVSDTEPDEIICLPVSRDHSSTAEIYCQVCKRKFTTLNALQHHLKDSQVHSKRLNKILCESKGHEIEEAATPPDAADYSGGSWKFYETILWSEFKNRLASDLRHNKRGRFDDVVKTNLKCLASFALNLQNRAELIAGYVEKQLPENTIETIKHKVVPIRLVFFIGSLCQKSTIFRDAFENRLVGTFIRAQHVSTIGDLKLFVDLRMKWEDLGVFKTETLEELDLEMSKDYPKWRSSVLEMRQSAKSKH